MRTGLVVCCASAKMMHRFVRSLVFYGIVKRMKALKSPLASRVLADPEAREQLRDFLTGKRPVAPVPHRASTDEFEIHAANGEVVRVSIVPKARAA